MRISYKWLQEFVEIDKTPEDLAELLTMHAFEVESVEKLKPEDQPDPLLQTAANVALEFSRISGGTGALLTQAKADDTTVPAKN